MAEVTDIPGAGETAVVRVGKRVYVGNLAWKTSWQDLKDKFRECGVCVYSNVMRDENDGRSKGWGIVEYENPQEAVMAINTLNGAELGGRRILVREDREDRDVKGAAALGHNGAVDGTVPLLLGVPRTAAARRRPVGGRGGGRGAAEGGQGRGGRGGGRGLSERVENSSGLQIVVQGIPWAYTPVELQDMFSALHDVQSAEIATGYDGRSRGFGTVRFGSQVSAQHAIATFNGSTLDGRVLAVFFDKYA